MLFCWLGESVESLQRRVIGIVLVHLTEARIILLCCVFICFSVIICFCLFFSASRISDRVFIEKSFRAIFCLSVDGTGGSNELLGVLLSSV